MDHLPADNRRPERPARRDRRDNVREAFPRSGPLRGTMNRQDAGRPSPAPASVARQRSPSIAPSPRGRNATTRPHRIPPLPAPISSPSRGASADPRPARPTTASVAAGPRHDLERSARGTRTKSRQSLNGLPRPIVLSISKTSSSRPASAASSAARTRLASARIWGKDRGASSGRSTAWSAAVFSNWGSVSTTALFSPIARSSIPMAARTAGRSCLTLGSLTPISSRLAASDRASSRRPYCCISRIRANVATSRKARVASPGDCRWTRRASFSASRKLLREYCRCASARGSFVEAE